MENQSTETETKVRNESTETVVQKCLTGHMLIADYMQAGNQLCMTLHIFTFLMLVTYTR